MSPEAYLNAAISWSWNFGRRGGASDEVQLLALLRGIKLNGSIAAAARETGMSYRHAWGRIEKWQNFFGQELVRAGRGNGSSLSPFADRLLRADAKVADILAPHFAAATEALRRELGAEERPESVSLRIVASHDMALGLLCETLQDQGHDVDLHFRGSVESLDLLARGECDAAGFHCPEGPLGYDIWSRYRTHLRPKKHELITVATRTQGIMVKSGNPKGIRDISDLTCPGIRFLNRQPGAGTRMILDMLLRERRIAPSSIRGYSSEEFTHGAVAAMIASGEADAGFGIEAAAQRFGLGFIPVLRERYWLAVNRSRAEDPPLRVLRSIVASPTFSGVASGLAGYALQNPGSLISVAECDALWAPPGNERSS
jgi:molybdate transport repressor ModE-like protein